MDPEKKIEDIAGIPSEFVIALNNKLRGLSPRANYSSRATTACW
jgi:hypothetical protein